ncbi:MAG TPA: GNAT family N-acetyltransferase [Acidimicrobiales bacterium]
MPGPDRGDVVVRPAAAGDAGALVDLLWAGAVGTSDEDPGGLARYRPALSDIAATPGTDVLVAERDGEVVGTCQLLTFRHLQHRGGRCAEIESMHVRSDLRGRGVGGLLLEAAVDAARAAGCYRVQLTSNAARTDAHRFYEHHGFTPSHVGFKRLLDAPV